MRLNKGLLVSTAICAALTAGAASAQDMCYGGTLNVGYIADAVGLDPHLSTALNSELMFQFVYSGLLKVDNTMAVLPDLAESWEISEDGLTYTFHLREGVLFHNGREMIADDVVYSFERILEAGGAFSARFSDVEDIEAVGDLTVTFTLSRPFAPFLSVLATTKAAVVPEEAVEQYGDLQTHMVGTGPFKFVEYRPGTSLILERNEAYYDETRPYLDRMEINVVPDEVSRITGLRTGELDFIQITDPLSLQLVDGNNGIKTDVVAMLRRNLLVLNVNQAPLDNVLVRQAIAVGIDRQEVVDLALGGFGEPSGPFPPGLAAWTLPTDEVPFYRDAPDIEQAKALLAEAGYPDGFTINTYAAPQYASHIPVAEVLQQQLARIGITLNIEVIEWGVLLDNWGKNTFETITMTYAGRSDPYFYTFERLHSTSPGNASRVADAEIDRLSEEGMTISDPEKRREIYNALQVRMAEVSALVYVATETEQFAMQEGVNGYVGMPDGGRNYLSEIWLEESCE